MNTRRWALGRRLKYGFGFAFFWSLIGALIFITNFYVPPSCFDGEQNGLEAGVDCDGNCVRICEAGTVSPKLLWAQSFEVAPGQYNAVAYIDNPNQIAGAPEIDYTFEFYDNDELITERSGSMSLPPNTVYPVFEGRVYVEEGTTITETKLRLESVELWTPASIERDKFRTGDINFSSTDSKPKLTTEVQNTSAVSAGENVEVVGIVYTKDGKPVTASQTVIEYIAPGTSQDIVFTWPNPIAKTIRSCIIPTDVVMAIDLSGSMNNDGDNPPQPLTGTLKAASKFAGSLKSRDQISLITFATNASLISSFSSSGTAVANMISSLEIDPVEETGFTNTLAAIQEASKEFLSERHNDNARKVFVLLTDGLPTTDGDDDIVSSTVLASSALSDSGVEVYAIALGQNVDRQFIQSIASDEGNAYFAPTEANLESIYQEITTSLCEEGVTKTEIIPKTKAVFTPLR